MDDERSPAVDYDLLTRLADDFDRGLPIASGGQGDGNVDARVGGRGGDADLEFTEDFSFQAITLQVTDSVVFDQDAITSVVETVPRATRPVDGIAVVGSATGNVIG